MRSNVFMLSFAEICYSGYGDIELNLKTAGTDTSACMLSNCLKLMFRLKEDSSISSLRDRSSVLRECSSVTACVDGRWRVEKEHCSKAHMAATPNLLGCIFSCLSDASNILPLVLVRHWGWPLQAAPLNAGCDCWAESAARTHLSAGRVPACDAAPARPWLQLNLRPARLPSAQTPAHSCPSSSEEHASPAVKPDTSEKIFFHTQSWPERLKQGLKVFGIGSEKVIFQVVSGLVLDMYNTFMWPIESLQSSGLLLH